MALDKKKKKMEIAPQNMLNKEKKIERAIN
jgi:hypothetical protein